MKLKRFEEIDFLRESNAIEGEYSQIALDDSVDAWIYAKSILHSGARIDFKYVKGIHKLLMGRINPIIAGKFRDIPMMVTNGNYNCAPPEDVRKYLTVWTRVTPESESDLENLHFLFNYIHPFFDGNGRTSRILMNIHRLQLNLPIVVVPEEDKKIYYNHFWGLG